MTSGFDSALQWATSDGLDKRGDIKPRLGDVAAIKVEAIISGERNHIWPLDRKMDPIERDSPRRRDLTPDLGLPPLD